MYKMYTNMACVRLADAWVCSKLFIHKHGRCLVVIRSALHTPVRSVAVARCALKHAVRCSAVVRDVSPQGSVDGKAVVRCTKQSDDPFPNLKHNESTKGLERLSGRERERERERECVCARESRQHAMFEGIAVFRIAGELP